MYWILLFGVLGQNPSTPQPQTIAEIRSTLNRIDDLSLAALDSLANQHAYRQQGMADKNRYEYVLQTLKNFTVTKLNIAPPLQDIEEVVLENLARKASSVYSHPDPQITPIKGTMGQLITQYPVMATPRSWHDTIGYGRVWGWNDGRGNIIFLQNEQPKKSTYFIPPSTYISLPNIAACANGGCNR